MNNETTKPAVVMCEIEEAYEGCLASDVVKELQEAIKAYGDLPVYIMADFGWYGGVTYSPLDKEREKVFPCNTRKPERLIIE